MSFPARFTPMVHPSAMGDLEQRMYLSLAGLQTWGMYRQGLNRSLLFELCDTEKPIEWYLNGISEVLYGCVCTETFPTTDELATFIWRQVEDADVEFARSDFNRQVAVWAEDRELQLAKVFGHPANDVRVVWADKVVTFIMDAVFDDVFGRPPKDSDNYRKLMAGIWFAMCDAAVGAQVETVTA